MTDTFRLVFRGEVLEGQHKAVVKQRLGAMLKLEGPRLDALFTGKAVTLRKAADTETAARFEVAFKRAGARLRVVTVEVLTEPEPVAAVAGTTNATAPAPTAPGLNLAPVGALMQERTVAAAPVAIDTSHLSLAAAGSVLGNPRPDATVAPPDVSHMTVAELGVDLQIDAPEPVTAAVAVPVWDIAKVGADLAPPSPPIESAPGLDEIDFEVAAPGARLAPPNNEAAPKPPDTSHIHLS